MSFWSLIKKLNYRQVKSISFLFLKRPLFVFPTIFATMNAYNTADRLYPKVHHKNGKANAFRHALWNVLICHYCFKWRKNSVKVVAWATTITDWHEEFSPNEPLDKAMDLHNNAFGRQLFVSLKSVTQKLKTEDISISLKENLKQSVQIESISDMKKNVDVMVYISDIE